MEPALADSVLTRDGTDPGGMGVAAPVRRDSFPGTSDPAPRYAAEPERLQTTAAAGNSSKASKIVISTDLADAERIVALNEVLGEGFTTDSRPSASTTGAQTRQEPRGAPFVKAARRTARYRMPRPVKRQLLDGFCGLTNVRGEPRTLMVVAHPDDESIGGGARLAELSEVWVAYATNGSPRNPEVARRHSFDSREAYAEQRRGEAIAALSLAGIDQDRVRWLGFDDGEALRNLVALCLGVAELVDTIQPNVVITHPYEGGHTDHDATAFAVHLACGILRREGVKPPGVFELTSYNAFSGERVVQEFLPHRRADLDQRLLRLGRRERELKQKMFDCFTTQQGVIRQFDPGVEKFRPAPRYVFTQPPHEGVLNYERYGDPALGKRFRKGAEEALQELRLRRTV